MSAAEPFDIDRLLGEYLTLLEAALTESAAEVAHVKAIGVSQDACGTVNLVANGAPVDRALAARSKVASMRLITNARVSTEPARLSRVIHSSLEEIAKRYGISITDRFVDSFRHGQPALSLASLTMG